MSVDTDSIVVPGEPGELRHLNAFLGAFWEAHALPPGDAMRVELGLEEVFINVVTHGLGDDRPGATVTVDLRLAGATLEVAVEDPGQPFDPLGCWRRGPWTRTCPGHATRAGSASTWSAPSLTMSATSGAASTTGS